MAEQEQAKKTGIKNLKKDIREYVEKRVELLNLTLAEEFSLIIADGIQKIAGFLILGSAVLFAWFAFAFLLSEWMDTMSGGFALASLPLFLMAFLFMKRKNHTLTEKIQAELVEKVLISFDDKREKKALKKKKDE